MQAAHNLLCTPLISIDTGEKLTLPGVLAALARDEVESFPALRPHQGMFWHMFLVQLAALALHKAGHAEIPEGEAQWTELLRGLTPGFPGDEPWRLVVEDWSKPAFMQPPVPDGVELKSGVATPDELDLPITSKNHDLKRQVARSSEPEDWLFTLISLQTGEGFGGAGNYGIARMNGGNSSRPMLTLAPMPEKSLRILAPRPGAWFLRDVRFLLAARDRLLEQIDDYPDEGGLGLVWLKPWPEGEQLQLKELDILFIEICRRIRLADRDGRIEGVRGTSRATRIDAAHCRGAVGDPWVPVHAGDRKSLTLGENGDFQYSRLIDLLFSGNWHLPLLAGRAPFETDEVPLAIVAQALARGNSKTGGFKSRIVPISSRRALWGWDTDARGILHTLATAQAETIRRFDQALAYSLVLVIAGGEREKITRESYTLTQAARSHLDRYADSIFFDFLWRRFDAEEMEEDARKSVETEFAEKLWERTQAIFDQFLPVMPCPTLFRHRAEVRARRALRSAVRKNYPELFENREAHRNAA